MLRIVVRAGMTMEMADALLEHLREITEFLESLTRRCRARTRQGKRSPTELIEARDQADASFARRSATVCRPTAPDHTSTRRGEAPLRSLGHRRAAALISRGVPASSTAWRSSMRTPNASRSRVPTIA